MKAGKLILIVGMLIVSVVLIVLIYQEVQGPVEFAKVKAVRYEATKAKLQNIKKAQFAYRDANGGFANTWDELTNALLNDSIMEVKITGNPDDQAEDSTVIVLYDTTYVPLDVYTFENEAVDIANLRYLPFSKDTFTIASGTVPSQNSDVPVFEVAVKDEVLLKDLNQDFVKKGKGLTLGSLYEAKYVGDWE